MNYEWLKPLQLEQHIWAQHNFPGVEFGTPLPMLGMFEELAEMIESKDDNELRDALADLMIFCADYCNRNLYDIAECAAYGDLQTEIRPLDSFGFSHLAYHIGKLAHAHLKNEQGIRFDEDHRDNARRAIAGIVLSVDVICQMNGFDFRLVVTETWAEVKKRDWRQNPESGTA